jgi:hypothetical protein
MQRSWLLLSSLSLVLLGILTGCVVEERPARPVVVRESYVVREAPPPPREEVIGVAPSPMHVWVPGYWAWHDRWVWVAGHWTVPPHRGAVWVPGHWEQRGRGWVWVSGHWGG